VTFWRRPGKGYGISATTRYCGDHDAEAIIGSGTKSACGLVTYTAAELQKKEILPLRWIVPGVIPEGLIVLAGKSGLGKSYFALQIGASVASGGLALGSIRVERGDVLYCALEDGEGRMQFRMQQSIEDGAAWPSEMHFTHHAPRIDEGLVNRLRLWLQEHPRARLIMLDVLVKIQSPRHRGDDQYAGAYGDLGPLQALALEFHIAINDPDETQRDCDRNWQRRRSHSVAS
jgi:AAA domain